MRLFVCLDCRTIEELPDYDGPMVYNEEYHRELPADDQLLEHLIAPHRQKQHRGQLLSVENEDWADNAKREGIVNEIQKRSPHTGFEPEVYAVKNTFQEEALKCFAAHRRPQDGCIDYKDRSKRLGNSMLTDEEKTEARRAGLKRKDQRFLCEFCPVEMQYVQKKEYEKQGYYK